MLYSNIRFYDIRKEGHLTMSCFGKSKIEELIASNAKLAELLHLKKEEEEPEKKNTAVYVFAIIGAIALIAIIAFAVYRYLNPAYVEDGELEDEFEDYGEDDFQDEETIEETETKDETEVEAVEAAEEE